MNKRNWRHILNQWRKRDTAPKNTVLTFDCGDNSIIVLKSNAVLSAEAATRIKQMMEEAIHAKGRVTLVLDPTVELWAVINRSPSAGDTSHEQR